MLYYEREDMPATTPQAREQQLIAKAERLAEMKLEDGTAGPQIICHFLKLGSSKAELEKQLLEAQVQLAEARTENLESAARIETLFEQAQEMFQKYKGIESDGEE